MAFATNLAIAIVTVLPAAIVDRSHASYGAATAPYRCGYVSVENLLK